MQSTTSKGREQEDGDEERGGDEGGEAKLVHEMQARSATRTTRAGRAWEHEDANWGGRIATRRPHRQTLTRPSTPPLRLLLPPSSCPHTPSLHLRLFPPHAPIGHTLHTFLFRRTPTTPTNHETRRLDTGRLAHQHHLLRHLQLSHRVLSPPQRTSARPICQRRSTRRGTHPLCRAQPVPRCISGQRCASIFSSVLLPDHAFRAVLLLHRTHFAEMVHVCALHRSTWLSLCPLHPPSMPPSPIRRPVRSSPCD